MSGYPLVYQQPVSRASARRGAAGWPNGPGRGPPIGFTSPFDLRSYRRAVAGSSREADFPTGYEAAPAMPRPNPAVHARFTSNSFNMLLFDIRHPSRDAERDIRRSCTIYAANLQSVRFRSIFLEPAETITGDALHTVHGVHAVFLYFFLDSCPRPKSCPRAIGKE